MTLDWDNPGNGFTIYRSQRLWPRVYSALVIRTSRNPESIIPEVQAAIAAVDPEQTIMSAKSMTHLVRETTIDITYLTHDDFRARRSGNAAGGDRTLRRDGVRGVRVHARNRNSFGVGRDAGKCSARWSSAAECCSRLQVFSSACRYHYCGCIERWALSFVGIGPPDPATLMEASILLALVSLLACWIPARQATRVDPLEALRYE